MMTEEYLTITEFAARLKLKPKTIKNRMAPGISDAVITTSRRQELDRASSGRRLSHGWRPDEADNIPIFYASELPALRAKGPDQLRNIFQVKCIFGRGMVRQ